MPNLTNLNSADLMAVTRAMDGNRNNRIDQGEANVTWQAHNQIGNNNGVAGTRELATSLEKGDVFISALKPEAADKVAEYFSKRADNLNKPVAEWVSDAWISKEDFDFEPSTRQAIDGNGDNRISSKEFSAALVSGTLTIGAARQVSQNPFAQPAPKPSAPSHGSDPFSKPAAGPSSDPFSKPAGGHTKPAQGTDPFAKPAAPSYPSYPQSTPDSGAYLQIDMARTMYSEYDKNKILSNLASKNNLSPREQVMLADASSTLSEYNKGTLLQTMAGNRSMSEDGLVQIAKKAREVTDYTRGQIVNSLVTNHTLPYRAQQSVIITIGTLGDDYSKTQRFTSLIQSQKLHPESRDLLLQTVREKVGDDYSKRKIMDAMF